jgi:hypothetical protein
MPKTRTTAAALILVLGATLAMTACSSSSSSSSSNTPPADFAKGTTVFFTPEGGKGPALPDSFVSCIYGKTTAGDRTTVAKLKSTSDTDNLEDAVGVRMTRNAHACDAALTQTVLEAAIFSGAPASVTAAQRTCVAKNAISAISGLDDTKLTGSNSSTVQSVVTKAITSCGVKTGS